MTTFFPRPMQPLSVATYSGDIQPGEIVAYLHATIIINGCVLERSIVSSFFENITVNGMVCGEVFSKSGDITINGDVTGEVTSVTGNITVNGRIFGRVESRSGDITVSESVSMDSVVESITGKVTLLEMAPYDAAKLRLGQPIVDALEELKIQDDEDVDMGSIVQLGM